MVGILQTDGVHDVHSSIMSHSICVHFSILLIHADLCKSHLPMGVNDLGGIYVLSWTSRTVGAYDIVHILHIQIH